MPRKESVRGKNEISRQVSLTQISVTDLNAFQRKSSLFFYVSFSILVVVIIICTVTFVHYLYTVDEHEDYEWDISFTFVVFFGSGTAMLVFRLFGINFFTEVLHVCLHMAIFALLLMSTFFHFHSHEEDELLDFFHLFLFPSYILLAVYLLQCIIAFPLVAFMPEGMNVYIPTALMHHAAGGLVTFIFITWNYTLHIAMMCGSTHEKHHTNSTSFEELHQPTRAPLIILASSMLFVLFIFFILLTPSFDYKVRQRINDKIAGRKRVSLGPMTSVTF